MRISDWSSDVCSSDLLRRRALQPVHRHSASRLSRRSSRPARRPGPGAQLTGRPQGHARRSTSRGPARSASPGLAEPSTCRGLCPDLRALVGHQAGPLRLVPPGRPHRRPRVRPHVYIPVLPLSSNTPTPPPHPPPPPPPPTPPPP